MAYHDDLRALARELAAGTDQARLRRAASTAYYALFHLLIAEAAGNWTRSRFRARIGRCFDHGPMKAASEAKMAQIRSTFQRPRPVGEERVDLHLWTVANTFVQAQQLRNQADYNLEADLYPVAFNELVDAVEQAFEAWYEIREEDSAQEYLVSLFGAREKRPNDQKQPPGRPAPGATQP